MAIGTIAAILGATGVGSNIIGGILGRRGASKAARTQEQAGRAAADEARQATRDAIANMQGATGSAQTWTIDAANQAAEEARQAAAAARGGVETAGAEGRDVVRGEYDEALARLAPYLTAGAGGVTQLAELMGPGGELNRRFGTADYQADPGYAFRLAEGQKALERSAAARGRVLGGGTLKALNRYTQGEASQEYGNAFERFQQENAARAARLFGLAGIGERGTAEANQAGRWFGSTNLANLMDVAKLGGDYTWAGATRAGDLGFTGATRAGEFGMEGARTAGGFGMQGMGAINEALTGAANARAAGQVAGANAMGQGIAGAGRSVMDAFLLSQLMRPQTPTVARPATSPVATSNAAEYWRSYADPFPNPFGGRR